jgi:hypothetical protein
MRTAIVILLISINLKLQAQNLTLSATVGGNVHLSEYYHNTNSRGAVENQVYGGVYLAASAHYTFGQKEDWEVKTGIRFTSTRTRLDLAYAAYHNREDASFASGFNYYQAGIPLHIGKIFRSSSNNNLYIEIFGGGSINAIGLLSNTTYININNPTTRVNGGFEKLASQNYKLQWTPTLDIGCSIPIIPQWPHWTFHVIWSANLLSAHPIQQNATVHLLDLHSTDNYNFNFSNSFQYFLFGLQYSFVPNTNKTTAIKKMA